MLAAGNTSKGCSKEPSTWTKTTFTTESVAEQGTSSQQEDVDKDLCDKDRTEDQNYEQAQYRGGNESDYSSFNISIIRGSSSTEVVSGMLQP